MKLKTNRKATVALRNALSCVALATLAAVAMNSPALAADTAKKATAAKATAQKAYATPEELFQALVDAAKVNDSRALSALLGPKGDALVHSGDAVADKQRGEKFAADYAAKHSVTKDGDAKATLIVGNDDWPMPIPAVKGAKGWTLDTTAGGREILARRIGQNELDAIEVVRAVVDAQRDYASADRDANGVRDYARKFLSSPGKKDGLYWPTKEGEPPSPLGPLVVQASSEGYKGKSGTPSPYHGYYYRILTAQGKDANGGALNYVVQGRMIGGFAVVAYPAQYGSSGIMSFIANYDGKVYQKDLGAKTTEVAKEMKAYNPDSSWTEVK